MAKTMTPSETSITSGQIGKIQEVLGAALRKSGLLREATQQVVTSKPTMLKLTNELLTTVRRYVEAVSNLIVRCVTVNRDRSHHEALQATGRRLYVDDGVVRTAPRGSGESVEVVFFQVGRFISNNDLEREYELRGLEPVDLLSLAAVNEDDPTFADDHPNGAHWQDEDNNWCYAAFDRFDGGRSVRVRRYSSGWGDYWWFGGVRKSSV